MQSRRIYTYHYGLILDKPMKMLRLLYSKTQDLRLGIIDTYYESWKPSDLTWQRSVPTPPYPLRPPRPQSPLPKPKYTVSHHKWQVRGHTLHHLAINPKLHCQIRVDQCSSLPPLRLLHDRARRVLHLSWAVFGIHWEVSSTDRGWRRV